MLRALLEKQRLVFSALAILLPAPAYYGIKERVAIEMKIVPRNIA
jgi:hypothetical protein